MKRSSGEVEPPQKRSRTTLNEIPNVRELAEHPMNVFVFGAGSLCELGLGPRVVEVKRPRLNPLLPVGDIGIAKIAVGGAHCIAVDKHGHLWTWGQNDTGALGRSTKIADDDLDDDDDLNPKESTPSRVEGLPEGLEFVAVGATDNLSAAITSAGRVWAWGTFIDDSTKMFRQGVTLQPTPVQLASIKGAVALAGGKDHMLILDEKGNVHSWGTGGSGQLGVVVNTNLRTKVFGPIRVPKVKDIVGVAAGDYQSFALDKSGKVWAWGLNNFAQCGLGELAGNGSVVSTPTLVDSIPEEVAQIASGNHHSVFLTKSGNVYTIGETNFHQLGVPDNELPASTVREASGAASYVPEPVKLSKGSFEEETVDLPKFKYIAAGSDHSIALSEDGGAWTWGFGEVYQLGHGKPAGEDGPEDQPVPTRIKNTATTGVNLTFCGAGGQFSVLGAAT